jgi:Holliday junction resolvasome RuvABC DNA-binding subunit
MVIKNKVIEKIIICKEKSMVAEVLKNIGYQEKDIQYAIENMKFLRNDLSDLVSEAIKIIASKGGNND